MKRQGISAAILTVAITFILPFAGGSGPPLSATATRGQAAQPYASSTMTGVSAQHPTAVSGTRTSGNPDVNTVDTEHLAQKPVPVPAAVQPPQAAGSTASDRGNSASPVRPTVQARPTVGAQPAQAAAVAAAVTCPSGGGGGGSAPGRSESGIGGTTSGDIQSLYATFNAIRIANCLQPIAPANFRYDSCMEQRLFWMAEDPSTNPGNTWGHTGVRSLAPDANGVYYSDAVPAKGCDGNLAGGSGNSGATVAQKWWDSLPHRASLYRPTITGSTAGVCIYFAMTHGGLPSEGANYARAAARWGQC